VIIDPNNAIYWLYEFIGVCSFAIAGALQRKAVQTGNSFVITVALLWGTLLHELTHYITALVLGARPSLPSLVAEKAGIDENGRTCWVAGSVTCHISPFNRTFIGLSPLLLLPLAAYVCFAWNDLFAPSM
jgi:hypothetical protein